MESVVGFIMICISLTIFIIIMIIDIFIVIKMITLRRRKWDVTVVTVVNTYLSLLFTTVILVGLNIATFLGDLNYQIFQDSIFCIIYGHLYVPSQGYLLNSFPLEALARFSVVVCRPNSWQRSIWTIFAFIVVSFVYTNVVYVLGIPLYNVHYITTESACVFDILSWKGDLCIFLLINAVPIIILNISYHFVLKHIRQSSQATHNGRQTNSSRDMHVLKRIMMVMIIALQLSIPPAVFSIVSAITGRLFPFTYRIGSLCSTLCISFISIGLALVNPHIKSTVWNGVRVHRVKPMAGSHKGKITQTTDTTQRQQKITNE